MTGARDGNGSDKMNSYGKTGRKQEQEMPCRKEKVENLKKKGVKEMGGRFKERKKRQGSYVKIQCM